ncbi:MAG: NAD(P)H-hydrate dehydratase [Clostridia bacterium]|nr:NAD(P)H-hydrate dehydratase [Clostridia bacterium]
MKKIVTCSQMKQLDQGTIRNMHIPSLVLMERAALATEEVIQDYLKKRSQSGQYGKARVLVVCGSGNNGGDGIAIARLLFLDGVQTEIYLAGNPDKMTEETRHQWEIAMSYQVPVTNNPVWDEYTVIVDGIFGVGLSREIEGHYRSVISSMNQSEAYKVAVDTPSGIDGDTGAVLGIAFAADVTVTFAYRKRGLCLFPGRAYAGEIVVADIGIYDRAPDGGELFEAAARHMENIDVKELPARPSWGNKGTFGKVLLIAGSKGMCGAAYLSASAALRGGAGMVKLQTVEENRIPLQSLLPEAMVTCEFDQEANLRNLNWCDVLVIGPGLGTDDMAKERMFWFLENGTKAGKPIILDADGLNILAKHPQWMKIIGEHTILTPHIGEMSRLTGMAISDLKRDPVDAAYKFASETGCVCVLKDACTVIADQKQNLYLNLSGNSGMATAGSGDVLSGMIAAVLCMYLSTDQDKALSYKAALAVYIHGLCGDLASKKKGLHGMTAKDLTEALPEVLKIAEGIESV